MPSLVDFNGTIEHDSPALYGALKRFQKNSLETIDIEEIECEFQESFLQTKHREKYFARPDDVSYNPPAARYAMLLLSDVSKKTRDSINQILIIQSIRISVPSHFQALSEIFVLRAIYDLDRVRHLHMINNAQKETMYDEIKKYWGKFLKDFSLLQNEHILFLLSEAIRRYERTENA